MKVQFTHDFIKIFKKRIFVKPNIHEKFNERVRQFTNNPHEPSLKDHALGGRLQGYRAFSITGDIRVIYYTFEDTAYFVNIGTHSQVY